jgi:hypothetical protein
MTEIMLHGEPHDQGDYGGLQFSTGHAKDLIEHCSVSFLLMQWARHAK